MNRSDAASVKVQLATAALPHFRVCLAVYNGTAWVGEQMDSIRAQRGVHVDMVVSVDLSEDGSDALVDEQARKYGGIEVLPHGGKFGNAARNFFRLIRDSDFSQINYVAFSDQDDVWLPQKLLRAHECLSTSAAAGYSSNVIAFWADGRTKLIDKAQPQRRWDYLFESAGPGCSYVIGKDLALSLQSWLREHWEEAQGVGFHDWLVYAFARAGGFGWVIDERPGLMYRQHGCNELGANNGWQAIRRRLCKVLDGWGLDQSLVIARLVGVASHPFVGMWSERTPRAYLRLALSANQCRRKLSHRMVFFVLCLFLALRMKRSR